MNSIRAAGFDDDYHNWHIAKHDVYGEKFRNAWLNQQDREINAAEFELIAQADDTQDLMETSLYDIEHVEV